MCVDYIPWIYVLNQAAWHLGEKWECRTATTLLTRLIDCFKPFLKNTTCPLVYPQSQIFLLELPSYLTCPPWTCTVNIYNNAIFSHTMCIILNCFPKTVHQSAFAYYVTMRLQVSSTFYSVRFLFHSSVYSELASDFLES